MPEPKTRRKKVTRKTRGPAQPREQPPRAAAGGDWSELADRAAKKVREFADKAKPAAERMAVDVPGRVLLPISPIARLCAHCGRRVEVQLPRFGEGVLLDLDEPVCSCGAKADLARDKAELRNGAVFLLEEISCRAALSIELPRAPQSEELPDAAVAQLLRDAFGATDELADDAVAAAD